MGLSQGSLYIVLLHLCVYLPILISSQTIKIYDESFEAFTAVMFQVEFSWVVMPNTTLHGVKIRISKWWL